MDNKIASFIFFSNENGFYVWKTVSYKNTCQDDENETIFKY